MSMLMAAFTMGLILALLSLGMLISFRMVRFTDITVDGSFTLGAAITAVLIFQGSSPGVATAAAVAGGAGAGMITGILHTRFKIQEILAGILMMTALYAINLRIMGRSNIPLMDVQTVFSPVASVLLFVSGGAEKILVMGWMVPVADMAIFLSVMLGVLVAAGGMHWFLQTRFGTALRAAGSNPQLVRAQGINPDTMIVSGLALSNGMVALAGSLLAQYQGFADVQMGIGMMVWGLAAIIMGEALVRTRHQAMAIAGVILGTLLFRLLIAIALRWGLNPNDLKLITAIFVFAALVTPGWVAALSRRIHGGSRHAGH